MIGHMVIGDRLWRVAHISRRNPNITPSTIEAYDVGDDTTPKRRVVWLVAESVSELDAACEPLMPTVELVPIMESKVAEALGFLPAYAVREPYSTRGSVPRTASQHIANGMQAHYDAQLVRFLGNIARSSKENEHD